MKIVIDLDKLLRQGRIDADEYARLKSLAQEETGSLAFNILVGFGVVATASGAVALAPSAQTTLALGLILAASGVVLCARFKKTWGLLGTMLLMIGTITAAGGMVYLAGGIWGFLIATVLCLLGAIFAKSGLLAAMSMLSLSAWIGCAADYEHAVYAVVVTQPTLTICVFSILSLLFYNASKRMPGDYQPLAIIAARTCLFIVNLGFWVGSLWGDCLSFGKEPSYGNDAMIPDWIFALLWAIAIVGTGVWATRNNKRWIVNLLAVFGAIHFYTQFFERLGASPASILMGGLTALGIAIAIVKYNKKPKPPIQSDAQTTPV